LLEKAPVAEAELPETASSFPVTVCSMRPMKILIDKGCRFVIKNERSFLLNQIH
jgi:hypothetical protein